MHAQQWRGSLGMTPKAAGARSAASPLALAAATATSRLGVSSAARSAQRYAGGGACQTIGMDEPTILVADDHPLFRAAVLHALRQALPRARVTEAASAATLDAALAALADVDLVLLDLAMPGARGFSALLHVRGERPDVPVVVISSNDHPRVIRRA